jgi:hypothetical protein
MSSMEDVAGLMADQLACRWCKDMYGPSASLRLGYGMEHRRLHFIFSTLIHHGGCILAL